jgi:hypothetical protein
MMSVNGVGHMRETTCSGSLSGFGLIGKVAEADRLPSDLDASLPFPEWRVPRDTAMRGRRAGYAGMILRLSTLRDDSHIRPAVVSSRSINMVNFKSVTWLQAHQFAVHEDRGRTAPIHSFNANRVSMSVHAPAPLTDKREVSGINRDVAANGSGPSMQRDADRPVAIDDVRRSGISTGSGTESSGGCAVGRHREGPATADADQGCTRRILSGHRSLSLRCRTPGVDARRGHFVSRFYQIRKGG